MKEEYKEEWARYSAAKTGQGPRGLVKKAVTYIKDELHLDPTQLHVLDIGRSIGNEAIYFAEQGFKVTALHCNPITAQEVLQKFKDRVTLATTEIPQCDVVSASFCLPFFDPETFNRLWTEDIEPALKWDGLIVVHLLGVEDGWNGNPGMTFFTDTQVKAMFSPESSLFQGFVQFSDPKKSGYKESKKMATLAGNASVTKAWHIFSIIARKKPEFQENNMTISLR